jgi:Zn-dependent protease
VSAFAVAVLVVFNLGIIYLLLAAPLGRRRIVQSRVVAASREKLWNALWPLGSEAGWSGQVVGADLLSTETARVRLAWHGRDESPVEHVMRFGDVIRGERFSATIVDDSLLDPAFWSEYRETAELSGPDGAVRVTLTRTDRYRGLAFIVFRYFALRREIRKLQSWAETGTFRRGGLFEHPLTQAGFAVLSALILWPLFGLNRAGFFYAMVLTGVVALHELGHMAAFRLAGHRRARMIFIPLLGGIAIGGRPYDSRFEVAFVALMGAGLSAFPMALAMGLSLAAAAAGEAHSANLLMIFAGCSALFNLANLVPMWKFDGGQVLRQICPDAAMLAVASFLLLFIFLGFGYVAGFPPATLVVAAGVFALLSLITSGAGVKTRHELKAITPPERLAMAAALVAAFVIHGAGVVWAAQKLV